MPEGDIRTRIVAAVGEDGARELLDVLTRSDADRTGMSPRYVEGLLADLRDPDDDGSGGTPGRSTSTPGYCPGSSRAGQVQAGPPGPRY